MPTSCGCLFSWSAIASLPRGWKTAAPGPLLRAAACHHMPLTLHRQPPAPPHPPPPPPHHPPPPPHPTPPPPPHPPPPPPPPPPHPPPHPPPNTTTTGQACVHRGDDWNE